MAQGEQFDAGDHGGPSAGRSSELSREVQQQLTAITGSRARLQGLVVAVITVSAGLEPDSTLQRIVDAAVRLVDARYGALGVLGEHGGLSRFVYEGISPEQRARMGHLPEGLGLLGLLITQPQV